MGKFLRSEFFAKIHHNYNHYITIEIFAILNIRKKIAKIFRRKKIPVYSIGSLQIVT